MKKSEAWPLPVSENDTMVFLVTRKSQVQAMLEKVAELRGRAEDIEGEPGGPSREDAMRAELLHDEADGLSWAITETRARIILEAGALKAKAVAIAGELAPARDDELLAAEAEADSLLARARGMRWALLTLDGGAA